MRYAPKHARPASGTNAPQGSRRGLLAIGEPSKGRHSASGPAPGAASAGTASGTAGAAAASGRHDSTVIRERSASLLTQDTPLTQDTRAARAA